MRGLARFLSQRSGYDRLPRFLHFLKHPRGRIALMGTLMALVWGAMLACQCLNGICHSPDWCLMSEVGRRLALGDRIFVDVMEQKGPLTYVGHALVWLLVHTQENAYLFANVFVWLCLASSSFVAALIVEEAHKPWLHLIVQALLAAVVFVPHVGCLEEWFVPFGMLGVLWVRRLARGKHVGDICWVVLGLAAAVALWSKFTCCAQFVFLLCYAAAQERTQGLMRASLIALGSCIAASAAVLLWLWAAGSLAGMFEYYLGAAAGGYSQRMSMWTYLADGSWSTTHVTSFAVGLPLALWAIFMCACSGRNRLLSLLIIAAGGFYLYCCFSTFIGYYRMQLSTLVVLGACETTNRPWKLPVLRQIDARVGMVRIFWLVSVIAIGAATFYTCGGTEGSFNENRSMKEALHEGVGDSQSVLVWQFDHVWAFGELGLDFPYVMPARYNANQDLWDATAGEALKAGNWEYVVVAVDETVHVGSTVTLCDTNCEALTVCGGMAVTRPVTRGNPQTNEPYRLP